LKLSLPAIKIENLSKQYRIGEYTGYKTIRETLVNLTRASFRKLSDIRTLNQQRPQDRQTIWALKEVSFAVEPGEVVGIIGRNGAGKSTLLKVLSKITEPTKGRIELRGRVGSLLEIGTGFHPELTGHENIYLYGAILGMDRREVTRKFDQIVAFAELEKFIETPVKRYSSGMYMRLAFAVAAYLETEILLVDEVLAVGDIAFQKKCLGMMGSVAKKGRTVLFVSHNLGAVRRLCGQALLLDAGLLKSIGSAAEITAAYEKMEISDVAAVWTLQNHDLDEEIAYVKKVEALGKDLKPRSRFLSSEAVLIRFTVIIRKKHPDLKIGFDLMRHGYTVFRAQQVDSPAQVGVIPEGEHDLVCEIPPDFLNCGVYYVKLLVSIHLVRELQHENKPVLKFEIALDTKRSDFHIVLNQANHPGPIFPLLTWYLE
jgi:lipopolysaccharide transport system ATP-binding protein